MGIRYTYPIGAIHRLVIPPILSVPCVPLHLSTGNHCRNSGTDAKNPSVPDVFHPFQTARWNG